MLPSLGRSKSMNPSAQSQSQATSMPNEMLIYIKFLPNGPIAIEDVINSSRNSGCAPKSVYETASLTYL